MKWIEIEPCVSQKRTSLQLVPPSDGIWTGRLRQHTAHSAASAPRPVMVIRGLIDRRPAPHQKVSFPWERRGPSRDAPAPSRARPADPRVAAPTHIETEVPHRALPGRRAVFLFDQGAQVPFRVEAHRQ